MRIKIFNETTKAEALQYLQPVTPTDEAHPAHWYHENNGGKILAVQKTFINAFKKKFIDCKNKTEINRLVNIAFTPQWPPYIDENAKSEEALFQANIDFWSKGFGLTITMEWEKMFLSFISFLNTLHTFH